MTPLQKAAQALIDRWLSPSYIAADVEELRKALDAEIAQEAEPVAVFNGLVDSGEHGAFNLDMLKMIPRGAHLYLHPPPSSFQGEVVRLVATELYDFQEATRCDTVAQFEAQQATTPVPEGYVLVPIEPTPAMRSAVNKLDDEMSAGNYDGRGCSIEQAWECLLSAAQGEKP